MTPPRRRAPAEPRNPVTGERIRQDFVERHGHTLRSGWSLAQRHDLPDPVFFLGPITQPLVGMLMRHHRERVLVFTARGQAGVAAAFGVTSRADAVAALSRTTPLYAERVSEARSSVAVGMHLIVVAGGGISLLTVPSHQLG